MLENWIAGIQFSQSYLLSREYIRFRSVSQTPGDQGSRTDRVREVNTGCYTGDRQRHSS